MALFRKFFYRKPPDGLLEIVERVYVFDCCFTTDVVEDGNYKTYISGIVGQLRGHLPDASFMVFNFREGENQSQIANILSEYDMTVIDYPRQYEGCPVLTMEMIHHCLRSGESWLLLGQNNVLLMHCERGGWPMLSFMLAALLIYRKLYSGEQKTLEMIHKQAPRELLQLMSPLNPIPSQLRYLQYVSRRNLSSEWPPSDRALTLDCMILRLIPNVDGEGGCRPIIRIYGQDPLKAGDRTPTLLYATPKRSRVRHYKQAECELVKIDVHCHVLGDIVLECISLNDDLEREQMMFRVMFNSAFIRSNILILTRDEIDTLWNSKDQFPKDFRTELLFSEVDAVTSDVEVNDTVVEEKGLPVEAFAKVQEIFSNVDWIDSKADVAHVLQHITTSAVLKEKLENSCNSIAESGIMGVSSPQELEKQIKIHVLENSIKDSPSEALKKLSQQVLKEVLDTDVSGFKTDSHRENASNVSRHSHESGKTSSDSVSTPKPLNQANSEASNRVTVSVLSPQQVNKVDSETWNSTTSSVLRPQEVNKANSEASGDVTTSVSSPRAVNKENSTSNSVQDSVSSPQPVNKTNSEKSNGITACVSVVPQEASKNEKIGQSGDSVLTLQKSNQTKIINPRIVRSPHSSPGSFNNSSSGSPKVMQRFQNSSSSLGITALLDDRDTYKSDAVSDSVVESPQPSSHSSAQAALPSPPCQPPPTVPPPPPPFSQPTTLESEDTALHQRSQLKTSVSPPVSFPQAPSTTTKKTSVSPPPPPPPPPPPFDQSPRPPSPSEQSLASRTNKISAPPSAPPPAPPPPPLPGTVSPLSTPRSSGVTKTTPAPPPPPPPPPPPAGLSPAPPPPPRGFPSAPPPPPPPLSGLSSAPPPPPPPPGLSSAPPPPPPPGSSSVPPPPIPPSGPGSTKVPPVPPPPGPGLSKPTQNGPGPPPPGPPGLKGRISSRLNTKSQGKKANLKPYHWLKLTRVMPSSLWAEGTSKAPEIDFSELENLFAASVPNSEKGKTGGVRASGPKSDKVQLIELRRAYNCEIMLSKVKIPLPDLMNSVLALDDSALDIDQVENLIKFCPTKEEMEQLKGYKGDKENLGKCEQFFLELMKVPRVESKLRVFSFKMQFFSQVTDLRKNLSIVNSASEEIRTSTRLKRTMQTILSLGNALNQGTARGSAVGFRLDSLLKLTDTRARNNKMTLMHYLCKVLAEKLPELLEFPNDLTNLEASTKIQLKFLAEEMQAISKGLEKVVQELTISGNDGPISENFCKILKDFLAHAEGEVRSLASLYSTVGRNADALAMYFGEDPAKVPFEQVVSTLLNFTRLFVRAHEENCKQLEFEKKKAGKEAENDKLKTLARGKDSDQAVRSPLKFQTQK